MKTARKPKALPVLAAPTEHPLEGTIRFWEVLHPEFRDKAPVIAEEHCRFHRGYTANKLDIFIYGHGWQKIPFTKLSWVADEPFTRWDLWKMDFFRIQELTARYGYRAVSGIDQSYGLQARIRKAALIPYGREFGEEFKSHFRVYPHEIDGFLEPRDSGAGKTSYLLEMCGVWHFDIVKFDTLLSTYYPGKRENESIEQVLVSRIGRGFADRFYRNLITATDFW